MSNLHGLIINSYGRGFIVEVAGVTYQAVTKGKKTTYVVGDQVEVQIINQKQLQILDVCLRHNLVYRTDSNRSKIIASNVSQILIIIAVKPSCNLNFLNSCLLFAESEDIKPIIVINKADLPESAGFIQKITDQYVKHLGYSLVSLSALNNQSLLIGQSGMGKSTITNQIIPEAMARVGEISKHKTSGCHTTTNASLYHIDDHSDLIDCPGLQEFGLYHLDLEELPNLFPELRSYLGQCRFRNCRHLNEPDCAITAAYSQGNIDRVRYNLFISLSHSLQQK
jgi:ribosome biogenesis GTPase / thiamine phosphate phosphatase